MPGYHSYFAGKKIVDWDKGVGIKNPETCAYRFDIELFGDEEWSARREVDGTISEQELMEELFNEFLQDPRVGEVTAIVIGYWTEGPHGDEPGYIVEWLCSIHEKLPKLTAILFGDIAQEQSEISWITHTDVSPLFTAYPALEHFLVRGSDNLHLGHMHLEQLKSLMIESAQLNKTIVQDILASHLPHLEHLELWMGNYFYSVSDFEPLLNGSLFPNLRYLGLCNSQIANELAVALVRSPLIERIRVLDLSMGLLDDTGALALLTCPAVSKLEKLDIQYHYCSDTMIERLKALPIEVDTSEQQDLDDDEYAVFHDEDERCRFIAVNE